jgi:hypothetical protein
MVKVVIATDGNSWHGMTAERLWATPVGISLYRLENSPLYAHGVSYQDIVVAREDENKVLTFDRVQSRGGHSTYRALLNDTKTKADFERYWEPIAKLGCTYESSRDPETVFSIDVPPTTDVYDVYPLLDKGEHDGIWEFEEGDCAHPLRDQRAPSPVA